MAISEREFYEAISANAVAIEYDGATYTAEEVIEFCDKRLAAIKRRSAMAKERSLKKRAEGGELQDAVKNYLADHSEVTGLELFKALDGNVGEVEVTHAKITAALRNLIDTNQATKEKIKGIMHYSLI